MVYYHLFGATDQSMFRAVIPTVFWVLGPYGNVCVMFFVLLTGYAFELKNRNANIPYPRRIVPRLIRLYQGYLIVFAVGFVGSLVLSQGRADPLTVYGNDPLGFVSRLLINLLGMSHLVYGDGLYTLNQTWWYMSLAVVLILALPLVMCIWRKTGWGCFVLFLALSVLMPDVRYLGYFPAAALGVCLAGCDGFAKVCKYTRKPLGIVLHFPVFLLGLFLWLKMRETAAMARLPGYQNPGETY